MDIEGAQAEPAGTEPDAIATSRRSLGKRLIGLGLGGAAIALVPQIGSRATASSPPGTGNAPADTNKVDAETPTSLVPKGGDSSSPNSSPATSDGGATTSAAPSTTLAPKRPVDADIPLLVFAQSVEIAAYELYQGAMELPFTDDERTVIEVIGQSHLSYGQALSGFLGRDADNESDEELVSTRSSSFSGDVDTMLKSAYDLESTLVATHISVISQLIGTDGANLLASVVTVEARNGTVLASLTGSTDLSLLLVDNDADALAPAKG